MQRKTSNSLSLMDWKVHSSGWPSVMHCLLPPVLLGESTQHRVWYQLLSKILSTEMTGGPVGLGKCAGRFLQLIPSMSEVGKYRGGGGRRRRKVHHENAVVLSQAFVVFFTPPDQTCSRTDFKSNFLQQYVIIQHILYANNMLSRGDTRVKIDIALIFLGRLFLKPIQFSCSVVSSSWQSHEPQYARPPCPSPTPRVHPNPCPLSQWCHPTISPSVTRFSSCPQSFAASGFFQMSQLFASGGQSIGVSASTSVLPMNAKNWSTLGWIII